MLGSFNGQPLASSSKSPSKAIVRRFSHPVSEQQSTHQLFPGIDTDIETDAPLRVKWECIRAALDVGISPSQMLPLSESVWGDYDSLGEHIARNIPEGVTRPQHSFSLDAWEECITSPETIFLKGSLTLKLDGKKPFLTPRLNPIAEKRVPSSFRLGRAFRGDRFLTINISLEDTTSFTGKSQLRDWVRRWLMEEKTFLNRTWRALFVRDGKKSPDGYEVKFFATGGRDLPRSTRIASLSAPLEGVIQWLIPLNREGNKAMPASKVYSRLELGFSKTYPTITFLPDQIHEVDDEYGDETEEDSQFNDLSLDWSPFLDLVHKSSPIMSDGCSRISVAAATLLWKHLGIPEPVPSAFQGRIANAKGLWLKSIDPEKDTRDPIWIETTASQRKFERHEEDRDKASYDTHRTTFDLLAWSNQLSSSHLSVSLLWTLQDRGVSKSSIAQFISAQMDLEKDLFLSALEHPPSLLKWTSERFPEAPPGGVLGSLQASMPKLLSERISFLINAGFEPYSCYYLSSLVRKGLENWLNRLGNKLEVRIPHSTSAFGIADFQRVLRPGEVFLSFSRALPDAQLSCLYDRDVLVARYPIHRPSDVQKVRAIYCPELASIQDVVVFSSRGGFPLAEKLSNGDYDGDRYWICWEPLLVREFQNAPPPVTVDPKRLGIHVESELVSEVQGIDNLLRKSFDFQLSEKMLGLCANYHEKYEYKINSLKTPEMSHLSDLRDCLVDASKNGYRFTMKDWNDFLARGNYPGKLSTPAYKGLINKVDTYKEENIIDYMKFVVIKKSLRSFTTEVNALFQHVPSNDEHLSGLYTARYCDSCNREDEQVREELEYLVETLVALVADWKERRSQRRDGIEGYEDDIEKAYTKFRQITPRNMTHPVIANWTDRPIPNGFPTWDLLKASALYAKVVDQRLSHFVFSLAGREFLFMKAMSVDPNTQFVTSNIMTTLKVRKLRDSGRKP